MIKDVVVQNGLLGIATGTFVCVVGIPDRGTGIGCSRGGFLRVARNSPRVGRTLLQRWWGEAVLARVRLHVPVDYFRVADQLATVS
jgi:hypothetical protein